MTQKFLDFSAGKGNNLKEEGVKDGMNWCLCAHRWQEAMKAVQDGQLSDDGVPRVHLHASDKSALDVVSYKDLKKYAVQTAGESTRQSTAQRPEGEHSIAKESKEISGNQPSDAPGAGKNQSRGGQISETSSSRG